jgi:hypothetical protein
MDELVADAARKVVVHKLTSLPPALAWHMHEQLAENDRLRAEGTRHLVDAAVAAWPTG